MNSEEHLFFYWTRITQEEKHDFSGLSSSDFLKNFYANSIIISEQNYLKLPRFGVVKWLGW